MNKVALLRSIAQANAGRDPQRLAMKYQHMAADKSAFFRGTASLFYALLPRDPLLRRAPLTWICGDLHLENFGSYRGENGLAYFDINDFDESALAPFTYDCVRAATHLLLSATALGLDGRHAKDECRHLLDDFSAELAAGKPRWIERRLADGALGRLLRAASARSQGDLLRDRTTLRKGRRRLKVGNKALPLPASTGATPVNLLQEAMHEFGQLRHDPKQFTLMDAARRVAGIGSLGLERYILLVRGDGTTSGARLLDLKVANPSCVASQFASAQPRWRSEATRIVTLQKRLQADSPALLTALELSGRSFVLRELQPTQDRLRLADLKGKRAQRRSALRSLMQLSAWSMLRGAGWDGAAVGQVLTAYATRSAWQADVLLLSVEMAKVMTHSWQVFRKFAGSQEALLGTATAARSDT